VLTVLKSGSLNLLEPSGPVQECTGIGFTDYCHWASVFESRHEYAFESHAGASFAAGKPTLAERGLSEVPFKEGEKHCPSELGVGCGADILSDNSSVILKSRKRNDETRYKRKNNISLTECNSGTIQTLPFGFNTRTTAIEIKSVTTTLDNFMFC